MSRAAGARSNPIGLALLLFVSVSTALWAFGNGVPFGYKGTETYATYLTAYNEATFAGLSPVIGDRAASPDPADHPVYDTHTPNLVSRVLGVLLIRSGISDLRAQTALAIALSTLGLLVAARVLKSMGGVALAATTILVFSLHYVGVLTWTSNLERAPYFLVFWGNLYLLQRYFERPIWRRLIAASAGIASAFVNDLTLGAFVLLIELFAAWQLAQPRVTRFRFTLAVGFGALVAVASWMLVLVLVLGPRSVAIDWPRLPGAAVGSAFRDMLAVGQGALCLVIYPWLIVEVLAFATRSHVRFRHWPTATFTLMFVALGIAISLWVDSSTRLIDEWEPLPGRPIVRTGLWVAVAGAFIAVSVHLRNRRHVLERAVVRPRPTNLSVSIFVVAAALAAVVMTVGAIGDFITDLLQNYVPGVVFVEDVILASLLLAGVRGIQLHKRNWLWSAGTAGLVLILGMYWLAFQVRFAMRYPPIESPLAVALGGNTRVAGATLIAADSAPVVWYYTRGRLASASGPSADLRAQFLVCTTACDRWVSALHDIGLPLDPGRNLVETPKYLLYAFPVCGAADGQLPCATQALPDAAPQLEPLHDLAGSPWVVLTADQTPGDLVAHVRYTYSQASGAAEAGSIVRVYIQQLDGTLCLIGEGSQQHTFHLPHVASGQFRAAVIPRSTHAIGTEYFSQPVEVRAQRLFELPDTRSGGTQQITATSLEEAEQIATERGTWAPGAGTLGSDAVSAITDDPPADEMCRGQS